MALPEISEDSKFTLSLKTMGGIVVAVIMAASFWFSVQAQIDQKLDKDDLPKPEISRVEFDLKDNLVRQQIQNIDENVKEIKEQLKLLEQRLYEDIK